LTRFYRRKQPGAKENLGAGLLALGLATGVAAVSFYLVRLFLAREPLEELEDERLPGGSEGEGKPED
jgi:hypothetical protein